jgi:hypothetical protein
MIISRRPEVQRHALVVGVDVLEARVDLRDDLRDVLLGQEPALRGVVVLPQRVSLEHLVGEDAAQVRVSVEANAVHVEDFALEPVVSLEEAGAGRNGLVLGHRHFDAHPLVLVERVELVHDVEPFLPAGVVDAPEVERQGVAGRLERGEDVNDVVLVDHECR